MENRRTSPSIFSAFSMFSTCSELTPRAPSPAGRMEQFMQPWWVGARDTCVSKKHPFQKSFERAKNLESNTAQEAKDGKGQVPSPWWAEDCFARMRSISDVCRSFNSRLSTTTVQAYLVGGSIHVQNSDNKLTELTNGFVQNLILMEGIIFCWLTISIWHANPTQCSFTALPG